LIRSANRKITSWSDLEVGNIRRRYACFLETGECSSFFYSIILVTPERKMATLPVSRAYRRTWPNWPARWYLHERGNQGRRRRSL